MDYKLDNHSEGAYKNACIPWCILVLMLLSFVAAQLQVDHQLMQHLAQLWRHPGQLAVRGERHRLLRRQPRHHHSQRRAGALERPRHGRVPMMERKRFEIWECRLLVIIVGSLYKLVRFSVNNLHFPSSFCQTILQSSTCLIISMIELSEQSCRRVRRSANTKRISRIHLALASSAFFHIVWNCCTWKVS